MSDSRYKSANQASGQSLPLKAPQASRPAPSHQGSAKRPQVTAEQRDDASMRSGRSGRSANSARSARTNRSGNSRAPSANTPSKNASPNYKLRCDDCVNKRTGDLHKQQKIDARKADLEFYRRVGDNDALIIEQEREREARKLREFQAARDQLLLRKSEEKKAQRERDRSEKKQLYDQYADHSDLIKQQQEAQDRLMRHRQGLDDQREDIAARKKVKQEEDRKLAQESHNLLIDDGWRAPHVDALKRHYHQNLVGQVNDIRQQRTEEKVRQLAEDRADLASMIRRQNEQIRTEQAAPEAQRRLFNEENARAVDGVRENHRMEIEEAQQTKNLINENVRNLEEISLANREKRDRSANQTAAENLARKGERRIQALAQKLEDRKYLTGLHIPQREVEVKECDSCRQTKDMKQQNRVIA